MRADRNENLHRRNRHWIQPTNLERDVRLAANHRMGGRSENDSRGRGSKAFPTTKLALRSPRPPTRAKTVSLSQEKSPARNSSWARKWLRAKSQLTSIKKQAEAELLLRSPQIQVSVAGTAQLPTTGAALTAVSSG